MDIKLKYTAWISEKHADIAHKLIDCDIETFAIEFAEHLVKNCSIPVVVSTLCWNDDCSNEKMKGHVACKECHEKVVSKT